MAMMVAMVMMVMVSTSAVAAAASPYRAVLLSHVDLPVSLQVALVRCGVVADVTDKVFLSVVNGQMALQQRFPTESSAAVVAGVAVVVEDHGVFPEGSFCVEENTAALQHLGAGLVHGEHVSLEVVPPVGGVPALRAREQLPAVTVRHRIVYRNYG